MEKLTDTQRRVLEKIIEIMDMSGKTEIYEQTPLRLLLEQGVATKTELWYALCELDEKKIVFRGIGGYHKLVRITRNGQKLLKSGLLA
jgi:hypothetical protein